MKLIIHCCYVLLFSTLFATMAKAQSAYSVHTLEQGETLSTLAKNYHTTVGDIMRMNGMNAQSKLQPGAQIKIPAGGVVVAAQKPVTAMVVAPATSNSATPKTHVVATGETLYHISQLYKIPMEQLKAINNLPDGNVKVGQTLLLTTEGAAAQLPKKSLEQTKTVPKETPVQAQPKEVIQEAPAKQNTVTTTTVAEEKPQPATTTQVTAPPIQPSNDAVENSSPATSDTYSPPVNANAPKEGFFTGLYGKDMPRKQEQVKNGSAMTFKSASGWADKKYYILMNDAPTGSIVKIKNGKNELYAKVLWNLSEMKENEGLAFRISTAAAAALGITDQKFDLKVNYYE